MLRTVTHETAGRGEIAQGVDRRQGLTLRKCHNAFSATVEKLIIADDKRGNALFGKLCKSRVELALGGSGSAHNLPSEQARGPPCILDIRLGIGLSGFTSTPIAVAAGMRSCSQFMALCSECHREQANAGDVAGGG